MGRSWLGFLFALICLAEARAQQPDYTGDVRPILARACSGCHGPEKTKSGFRVDLRRSFLEGGDFGQPLVVPGDSGASRLLAIVSGVDPELRMPPEGDGLSLSEISILRRWVDEGFRMPEQEDPRLAHWAFQRLADIAPPVVMHDAGSDPWVSNPVDAYVLAALRKKGLEPSLEAPRWALQRRLRLVLHGLRPTLEELHAFESETRPDAWPRQVDAALASPRYGERWAQHWLDVIRFAETWGYETNKFRPLAFHFRDWVIDALNRDLSYDRFVLEQLAGDTVGVDAATGFLVAGPANLRGQIGRNIEAERQARQDELDEIIKSTSAAFLGLTVGCARCHNHKFDPISQREYYELQAAFSGVFYGYRRLRGREDDRWTAELPAAEQTFVALERRTEEWRLKRNLRPAVRSRDGTEEAFSPREATAVRMWIDASNEPSTRTQLFELEAWTTSIDALATRNVARDVNGGKATASSYGFGNQTRHPDNLNNGDGPYPWMALESGPAWVQLEWPQPATIDRIVWHGIGRSFPVDYRVEVRTPDGEWQRVAGTRDRMLHRLDARTAESVSLAGVLPSDVAELLALFKDLRTAQAAKERLAVGPQSFTGIFREPETAYRLHRGNPMQRREVVAPDVPTIVGELGLDAAAGESQRRTALARGIANPESPLAARVIVNRLWQHHFGVGIVDTPSDFGVKGSRPTHPGLIDWLAGELVRSGWSLKHIHRLILTSSTFRQASVPRQDALEVDADSRLYWRFPPRRLDGEALRDSILQVSGRLNVRMFGEGFDFFDKRGGLSDTTPVETFDADGWRRMIYATKIRKETIDIFGSFDCPDSGQMMPKRQRSITPLQALSLFNSTFVKRQAGFFAERVRREIPQGDLTAQVSRAATLAFSRTLDGNEVSLLVDLCREHGLEQVCRVLQNANEFVFLQ